MVMMYDEPFTGLDPISTGVIANLIRRLNEALGATSILVTHDVQEALELVPANAHPMDVMRTGCSVLGTVLPERDGHPAAEARADAEAAFRIQKSELAIRPRPHSPASNAFFQPWRGLGSP